MHALTPMIPHIKALHISMLALWCAGLFALPLLLSRHDGVRVQSDYNRIHGLTHFGYVAVTTPAAVLAIFSGLLLIFLRDVFELWLFAKLFMVALLVCFHVWVGRTIGETALTPGRHEGGNPMWQQMILVVIVTGILTLVLGKPELAEIPMPDWLSSPRDVQLPFDVPRR